MDLDINPMERLIKCDECKELVKLSELRPKISGDNTILVCENCK